MSGTLTARSKIQKEGANKDPTDVELRVAQAIYDLQVSPSAKELAEALKPLHISSAKEFDVSGGRKATVIFVPYRLHAAFKAVQLRLIRELEKKFGHFVVIVANRKVLSKPGRNNQKSQQKRPRSRTLAAVHEAILDDLVYPTDIVGKRTRFRVDGSRCLKIYLDTEDRQLLSPKVHAFTTIYKKLTGKDAAFLFPIVKD
mmetsp:Transcript_119987/g.168879  ORF Transcript_119987/g.168879 Transcript_119987/m.168879 type:complete len:200 (+) Transcript_119987:42-641(+)